ncbi:MAG: tyrS [Deltaproteobacteria bacterium]|nr:tyrS [Deltaproteobacteria bacterium]
MWLDPQRTSPYEYYQFWINTDDRDVIRFLALFTFLPMEEIQGKYGKLEGADLRKAKEALADEATKIVHGEDEAEKARNASINIFGGGRFEIPSMQTKAEGGQLLNDDAIPTVYVPIEKSNDEIPAFKLFSETTTLCASGSEARRLIEQGGAYIDDKKVERFDDLIKLRDNLKLRVGKKKFKRIKILDKK